MTLTLQLILIILSVFLFLILIKSVKKGKLRSDYALVWLLCSIALIIVAIFPQIAYFAANFIRDCGHGLAARILALDEDRNGRGQVGRGADDHDRKKQSVV